jgi:hypothetical protein
MYSLLLGINDNTMLYMTILYPLLLQFGIIPLKAVNFVNYTEGPVSFQLLERLWESRLVVLFRTTCDST